MNWTTTPPTAQGVYRLAEPGRPVEDVWVDHSLGGGPLIVYFRIGTSGAANLMRGGPRPDTLPPGTRWMYVGPLPSAPESG